MASKSARIADFCYTLSGLADFKSTDDRGLAESFGRDSGLFMSGSSDRRYQNEVRITLVRLRRYVAGLSHEQAIAIKRNSLKNWHKNIIYRSLQDLVVKLYHTNFRSNADSDLNKNNGGLTDLAKK